MEPDSAKGAEEKSPVKPAPEATTANETPQAILATTVEVPAKAADVEETRHEAITPASPPPPKVHIRVESPPSPPIPQLHDSIEDVHPKHASVDNSGNPETQILTEILAHLRWIPKNLGVQSVDDVSRSLGQILEVMRSFFQQSAKSHNTIAENLVSLSNSDDALHNAIQGIHSSVNAQTDATASIHKTLQALHTSVERQSADLGALLKNLLAQQEDLTKKLPSALSENTAAILRSASAQERVANLLEQLPSKLATDEFTKTFIRCTSRVIATTLQSVLQHNTHSGNDDERSHLEKVHKVAHAILTLAQKVQVELDGARDVTTGLRGADGANLNAEEDKPANDPNPSIKLLKMIEEESSGDFELPNVLEFASTPEAGEELESNGEGDGDGDGDPKSTKGPKRRGRNQKKNSQKPQSTDGSPKTGAKRKAEDEESADPGRPPTTRARGASNASTTSRGKPRSKRS
jgi:hypothetical protein